LSIDITFEFHTDTPPGKDPDAYSPTLRRYHELLWSKPLPDGRDFMLTSTHPGSYLHHKSDAVGEFHLASDSVMQTYTRRLSMQRIVEQVGEEACHEFWCLGYTIGGMILFPGKKIDGKITINGARGFHPSIADRMDLTLECIRRHYRRADNPLRETLDRYGDFFTLFGSFGGYVDFWLLHDMVDGDRVRFFLPFDGFPSRPVPRTVDDYRQFRERSMEFIHARNSRIACAL
jgi:hypothetical protein